MEEKHRETRHKEKEGDDLEIVILPLSLRAEDQASTNSAKETAFTIISDVYSFNCVFNVTPGAQRPREQQGKRNRKRGDYKK